MSVTPVTTTATEGRRRVEVAAGLNRRVAVGQEREYRQGSGRAPPCSTSAVGISVYVVAISAGIELLAVGFLGFAPVGVSFGSGTVVGIV